jgi:transcriptional regulator with GAF, ATPase, and Fis domain
LTRVGGVHEVAVDVRVVAATNRDPAAAVADGTLRADLYYRLADFPIELPPLRDRREDIVPLAQRFLDRLNERYGTQHYLTAEVLKDWVARDWPGNVRELRHVVQRAYVLAAGDAIGGSGEHQAPPRAPASQDESAVTFQVGTSFEEIEREMLLRTLAQYGNNQRQAARVLGITPKTIYNRLLRYRAQGLIGDELLRNAEDAED